MQVASTLECPVCHQSFKHRRKKCCPHCGTKLFIHSDPRAEMGNTFWIWTCNRDGWFWRFYEDFATEVAAAIEKLSDQGIEQARWGRPISRRVQ